MKPKTPHEYQDPWRKRQTPLPLFDGPAYEPNCDKKRLVRQQLLILGTLRDQHRWVTVEELKDLIGLAHNQWFPEPSISAQLRNLRKAAHGSWNIEGRYRVGARIYEYRLIREA